MAINTETFFGRSTSTSTAPVATGATVSGSTRTETDVQPTTNPGNEEKKTILSELIQIDKDVKKIQKLIAKGRVLRKKEQENNKKQDENKKREEKELRLEKKKETNLPRIKATPFPKMGFLDRIRQFLFYTLLGSAFVKFGKHIPEILKFTKLLVPAFEFFEKLTGNILNGIVDFIGAGYKAQDKIKEIAKTVGGEDLAKKFDEFNKQFNTFANLAIIAGLAATGGGVDFGGEKRERLGVDKQTGRRVSKRSQARFLERYGEKAYVEKFGKRSYKGLTGKTAGRFTGRFAGKALGKIPIIGGLVDFIISTVIFKEKPGRAAAKALGSTIGSALGTFVPVPFAGTILGGILGDLVGGALYDSIVGDDKLKGKAKGGQATRGGKKVGGAVKRTIRKVRSKPPRTAPQKSIPGKDIGGKKQIEKLFPTSTDPRQKNPLGVLENTSKNLKRIPLLGNLMGASIDLVMGQRPEENTFKKIGKGFGYLIQSAIDAETTASISNIQRQIVGLAGGGMIPRTLSTDESVGMKIGERIAKTLQTMVNSKVSNTLQAIRQQLNKQDIYGGGVPGMDGGGGAGGEEGESFRGGQFSGSASNIPPEGKALLDAIAGSESSGYNSRYPSKSFDNNWVDHPRISEVIRSGPNRGRTSDAAGRYQFLSSTWDQYKPAKAFTPENQDIAAYRLAIAAYGYGESGLINDLKKDPAKVARKLSKTWTSLPGGIEPNNATRGFESRFQSSLKKYKNASEPTKAKNVKKFSRSDIISFFRQQESFRKKPHEGMDLAAPQGTPISFGMGGEVIGVWRTNSGEKSANGGYGTYMDIKFSDGRIARIAHLSSVPTNIKKGTKFGANQIIAYSGGEVGKPGSGRSGGPHIHLEQLSMPMGIEETTKGKYDPIKGGVFNLIQQGGKELSSIIPNQPSNVAVLVPQPKQDITSPIAQKATYEEQNRIIHSRQTIFIEKQVPAQVASGAPTAIYNNNTLPITADLIS